MPKFAKRFLIIAAAVLAVIAIILLCINIYLQSSGVQQRIRAAASQSLGSELKISSTIFTPWEGLVLRGLSIQDPSRPDANIIEAAALRIRFAFFPLFQQRFVVTECALFEPKVIIRQLESGDWQLPVPPLRTADIPLPAAETPGELAQPKVSGPSFKSELHRFRVGGGTLTFVDSGNRTVFRLEHSNIDAAIAPDLTVKGTFRVGSANISNSLYPRRINGDFTWDGKTFDVPDISGAIAGGKILARYQLVSGDIPTFTMAVELSKIQLRQLAEEATMDAGKTEGELQGTLDLAGDARTSDSLTGKGHFELIAARFRPVEFLVKLGELLRIEELQLLTLQDAKIDLTIGDKKVQVDDITLKSENLILRGQGPVRFDGKLDLDAQLMMNKKLQGQLKGLIGRSMQDSEDPNYRQVPFNVTGKLSSPKTDLLDKLVGFNIGQDVGGLLKNLFRTPAPPKSDDKKKNE